jgi:hypothetical protein
VHGASKRANQGSWGNVLPHFGHSYHELPDIPSSFESIATPRIEPIGKETDASTAAGNDRTSQKTGPPLPFLDHRPELLFSSINGGKGAK